MKPDVRKVVLYITAIMLVVMFSALFVYMTLVDNVFTIVSSPQAENGVITLLSEDIEERRVLPLKENWQFYKNKLLTPDDFKDGELPYDTITLGNHVTWQSKDKLGNIDGVATYRMIVNTDFGDILNLYLSDVQSAYTVYVNGELKRTVGNPDPKNYRPFFRDVFIDFVALPQNEIVIQVANFSSYYSGIHNIPFITLSDNLLSIIVTRFFAYSFVNILAVVIFATTLYMFVASGFKNSTPKYFFIICLSYFLFCSKNLFLIWRGYPAGILLTIISSVSLIFMRYYLIMFISNAYGITSQDIVLKVARYSSIILIVYTVLIITVIRTVENAHIVYYILYKGHNFCFVVYSIYALICMIKNKVVVEPLILAGIGIYTVGVSADIFIPSRYQTIYFLNIREFSGFILVLLLGVMMAVFGSRTAKANAVLSHEIKYQKFMFSNIAHDLKAPASAMVGYLNLVYGEDRINPDDSAVFIEKAKASSDRFVQRVQNLNFISNSLEAPLELSRVDLDSFLNDILEIYKPLHPDITFKFITDKQDHLFLIDKKRFTVAVENLLENAVRFTKPNGSITVWCYNQHNRLNIEIQDTGKGIEREKLAYIFDRFFTDYSAKSANGLGLAIVKLIVKEHKGSISVHSELGEGTTFTITLNRNTH